MANVSGNHDKSAVGKGGDRFGYLSSYGLEMESDSPLRPGDAGL